MRLELEMSLGSLTRGEGWGRRDEKETGSEEWVDNGADHSGSQPPRKKKSKGSGFDLAGSNPSSATDEQRGLEQAFKSFMFLVIHLTLCVCVWVTGVCTERMKQKTDAL